MKKFIVSISALLIAISLIAPAPQAANAQVTTVSTCFQFSSNLSQGMRDMSQTGVLGLQTFLNANSYLTVQPTGFFGTLTLSAVKQFQGDNGISQTGYVGPITRAKIGQITCSAVNAAGCASTTGFSITTGRSCAPVAYPPGCTSLSGYSTTTGLSCAPVTVTTTTIIYPEGCTSAIGYSSTTGKSCDDTKSTTTTSTTSSPASSSSGTTSSSSTSSSSSSTSSSSSSSQPTYPEGCTSFSGSSVTTDMPCDGSMPPEPASPDSCAESNYDPETGEPCQ